MAGRLNLQPLIYFGIAWIVLLVASPNCPYPETSSILIALAIIVLLVWPIFHRPRDQAFANFAWTIAGIIYIGWMISYWIGLRNLAAGRELVFLAMFTTFANDTGAFFIGRSWGKHHLAPSISSGKTWEGAVGGLLSSVAAAFIISAIFRIQFSYWEIAVAGIFISVFAQLGDLVESLLKRNTGVKDAGKLVPGHGGIMDRMDSLIFTGVIVYYLVELARL